VISENSGLQQRFITVVEASGEVKETSIEDHQNKSTDVFFKYGNPKR